MSTAPTRCLERYSTIFIFRSKIFFSISRILDVARARRKCQRHLCGALKRYATIFIFQSKMFFFRYLESGFCTGATEVSTAPSRCPERYTTIFIFRSKIFFSISRILDVARTRRRCQGHLRGALKGMRLFLFFGPKFFFWISRILDVARARRRCQRHLRGALKGMRPFTFVGPNFFFYISNPGCGTGATEVSTTPTRYLERYATNFIFWSKIFFSISGIRI